MESSTLSPAMSNVEFAMQLATAQLRMQQDVMESVGDGVLQLLESVAAVTNSLDGDRGHTINTWA